MRHFTRCAPNLLMKTNQILAVACCTLLVSGCSFVGNLLPSGSSSNDFDRSFYAGIGGAATKLTPATDGTVFELESSESAGAFGLVGMDYSKRISVEALTADLGSASLTQTTNGATEEIGYSTIAASGLLYGLTDERNLYERTGLLPYVRLGVSSMSNEADIALESEDNVQIWFGAGADYMLESGFGVRAEVSSYDGDAQAAQLALLYRFGDRRYNGYGNSAPVNRPVPASPTARPNSQQQPTVPQPVQPRFESPSAPAPSAAPRSGSGGLNGVLRGVEFAQRTADLTPIAAQLLDRLAALLQSRPMMVVEIRTYTDTAQSSDAALALTRARAATVGRYLLSRGVNRAQLRARAFGSASPRASNDDAGGRRLNNRVEIYTLSQ